MKELYRKRGRVTRYENGWLVRVEESGIAVEDGELFSCEPSRDDDGGEMFNIAPGSALRPTPPLPAIPSIPAPLRIERLIITSGTAAHEFAGKRWTDTTQRIHLSIVHAGRRVLIDAADFDDVADIANAFARAELTERDAPKNLRLAPNVSAALLPAIGHLVELRQTAGGIDGKGNAIAEGELNWYRPSYRVRPMRVPMDIRAIHPNSDVDASLPRAVALLAPVTGPLLRVLIDDGRTAYPATVRVERILAVGEGRKWYPYGAGSFGGEMML
ncbi:MAG TPA: hypothetical protein VGF69_13600 [Thermoanaerobaculia bacterium]|jgi:hypothetical protein